MLVKGYVSEATAGTRTSNQERVKLDMSRVTATELFHDLNRILLLIDAKLEYIPYIGNADTEAYRRLSNFLKELQPVVEKT